MEKPTTPRPGAAAAPPLLSRHRAVLLVLASQLAAAVLHALARLLETRSSSSAAAAGGGDDEGGATRVHPFTILQVRLLVTSLGCCAHLRFFAKTPDFPLGRPELRPLLTLRAAGGVLGACGFYVSIAYISLSEATALNFLAPLGALILTRYLDNGMIALGDGIACAVALASVVLVLQPGSLFGTAAAEGASLSDGVSMDPHASLKGTLAGMVGVVGGVIALSAINRIGTKAHPLLSVNYFSCSVFAVTTVCSFFIPEAAWPRDVGSWCLMILMGIIGFSMEYLLTAGLGSNHPGATVMIYSQVLWALLLEWLVWHSRINALTIVGCVGVVASLVTISLAHRPRSQGRSPVFGLESGLDDVDCDSEGGFALEPSRH